MEPQSLGGRWWLPNTPEAKIGGTLTFTHGKDNIELLLFGAFTDTELGGRLPRYELVFGETTDGRAVTLRDAWSRGAGSVHRSGEVHVLRETVSAMELFIGAHLPHGENTVVSTLMVSLELLADWAWPTPFAREQLPQADPRRVTIAYELPAALEFEAFGGSARIEAGMRWSSKTAQDQTVVRPVHLVVDFSSPRPYRELLNAVVKPFQYFLTLVCAAPTQLLNVRFQTPEVVRNVGELTVHQEIDTAHVGWRPPTSEGRPPRYWEMLLPMSAIGDRMTEVMERWSRILDQAAAALDVFFAIALGPSHYLETRFLLAVQALEVYHRKCSWFANRLWAKPEFKSRRQTVLDDIDDLELRSWVEDRLQFANEPTLRARLAELVDHGGPAADRVCAPVEAFVELATITRNHLTHYDGKSADRAAKGRDLAMLAERAMSLMEVSLLVDLGIPQDEVSQAIERTRRARLIFEDVQ